MKARLAQKILKVKYDYMAFNRLDFPYTGLQLYRAALRAHIPMRDHFNSYCQWHKVSKAEGQREIDKLFGRLMNLLNKDD